MPNELATWKGTTQEALEMCRAFIRGDRKALTKDEVGHLANVLVDATDDPPEFSALPSPFPKPSVEASLVLLQDGQLPVELDVRVLRLQPEDTLVFKAHCVIKPEAVERIRKWVDSLCPGVKAMVLEDLELVGVLRAPNDA